MTPSETNGYVHFHVQQSTNCYQSLTLMNVPFQDCLFEMISNHFIFSPCNLLCSLLGFQFGYLISFLNRGRFFHHLFRLLIAKHTGLMFFACLRPSFSFIGCSCCRNFMDRCHAFLGRKKLMMAPFAFRHLLYCYDLKNSVCLELTFLRLKYLNYALLHRI